MASNICVPTSTPKNWGQKRLSRLTPGDLNPYPFPVNQKLITSSGLLPQPSFSYYSGCIKPSAIPLVTLWHPLLSALPLEKLPPSSSTNKSLCSLGLTRILKKWKEFPWHFPQDLSLAQNSNSGFSKWGSVHWQTQKGEQMFTKKPFLLVQTGLK